MSYSQASGEPTTRRRGGRRRNAAEQAYQSAEAETMSISFSVQNHPFATAPDLPPLRFCRSGKVVTMRLPGAYGALHASVASLVVSAPGIIPAAWRPSISSSAHPADVNCMYPIIVDNGVQNTNGVFSCNTNTGMFTISVGYTPGGTWNTGGAGGWPHTTITWQID